MATATSVQVRILHYWMSDIAPVYYTALKYLLIWLFACKWAMAYA